MSHREDQEYHCIDCALEEWSWVAYPDGDDSDSAQTLEEKLLSAHAAQIIGQKEEGQYQCHPIEDEEISDPGWPPLALVTLTVHKHWTGSHCRHRLSMS